MIFLQRCAPPLIIAALIFLSGCVHHPSGSNSNYIFGYGSLINSDSRASTAGKPTPAIPVRVSKELGYVRSWNFRSDSGFTALGLHKVQASETAMPINGVIYEVEGTMEAFDERETGYDRLEVGRDKITALKGYSLPPAQAKIWVYVPQPASADHDGPMPADARFPLLQSYLDVCLTGTLEYGEDFADEFLRTTIGWGPYWLNDRLLARRPWVYQAKYKAVDKALNGYPESHTKNRLFMVDYAARFGQSK